MASSKVMASSKPKSSDLTPSTARSRRASSNSASDQIRTLNYNSFNSTAAAATTTTTSKLATPLQASTAMTVDEILRDVTATEDSTLLDAQITLIDNPAPPAPPPPPPQVETNQTNAAVVANNSNNSISSSGNKTVDEVWREIVTGRKEMKEEQPDEMMTLEDFLARAGAVVEDDVDVDDEVKMPLPLTSSGGCGIFPFDNNSNSNSNGFQILDKVEGSIVAYGNGSGGRGKRGRSMVVMEPLDKAAQQRQRRMIKNRESAARSRERKQAYQVELESLAVKLEEENVQLLKEKEESTKERYKQLMEKVVPVVEKRKPPRMLRRVNSMRW